MSEADTILACQHSKGNIQKVRLYYADGRVSNSIKVELPELQRLSLLALPNAAL